MVTIILKFFNNCSVIGGADLPAHVCVRPQLFSPAAKHLLLNKNRTLSKTTGLLIARFPKYFSSIKYTVYNKPGSCIKDSVQFTSVARRSRAELVHSLSILK